MKRSILIGFALAVASSSAYAWTEISHYKNQDTIVYKIRCNNKTESGVTYGPAPYSGVMTYFVASDSRNKPSPSLDSAAKSGCKEK